MSPSSDWGEDDDTGWDGPVVDQIQNRIENDVGYLKLYSPRYYALKARDHDGQVRLCNYFAHYTFDFVCTRYDAESHHREFDGARHIRISIDIYSLGLEAAAAEALGVRLGERIYINLTFVDGYISSSQAPRFQVTMGASVAEAKPFSLSWIIKNRLEARCGPGEWNDGTGVLHV
jgi:hypothetical protein